MEGKIIIDGKENEPIAFKSGAEYERRAQFIAVFCPHHHVWHHYKLVYRCDTDE